MNKQELVDAIASDAEFSKIDTSKFIDSFVKVVTSALAKGDTLQLIGFASFSVVDRAARKGRNPQTGKEIEIAASKAVKFTVGKVLKEAVNNNKPEEKTVAKKANKK